MGRARAAPTPMRFEGRRPHWASKLRGLRTTRDMLATGVWAQRAFCALEATWQHAAKRVANASASGSLVEVD